jgi:hypothetical protein
MKKHHPCASLLATSILALAPIAHADAGHTSPDSEPITLAVFGDWPYNRTLLDSADRLIGSINNDPDVRLVMHVGDTHSGSMACTGAGLKPRPAGAAPDWNKTIFELFQQFDRPLVYTPGDNEWTDCHKEKELGSGAPLNELEAIRRVFFSKPGYTLGKHEKRVQSQAEKNDPAHPDDRQYAENLMWEDAGIVFLTVNMPGSDNDGKTWTAPYADESARTREVALRTGADIRWLERGFALAGQHHAKAIVIAMQADMWDLKALAPDDDGLSHYTPFVQELAKLCLHFKRPVLLINGDSHHYGSDRPLAEPASATGRIHAAPAVANLTRITVQGATSKPGEWLRLTISPGKRAMFSWQNVTYCRDPLTSCQ